jgi:RND family efflux transporter MFP subunit
MRSAILLACALLAGCGRQQPARARQESGPVAITVAPVSTRQVQRVVEAVGTLFPYDEVVISAEVEGKLDQVNADLGDAVRAGQVLARISEEEQRYLVAQNEAQLRQSLERLGLKSDTDRVTDIRETPEVRRAQADLSDAEQRLKRMRGLADKRVVSDQDVDAAVARYQAMQAAYDTSLNQTRNLIQEVERFKATLDLQRKKLRDTSVRAPFPGHVKDRQATLGKYVQANTPLFTLVKIDPIRLRIEIPERMAPWVKEGQQTEVAIEAFADRTFRGKIWRISPTVDQSKRTFIVEALIPNPASELKPGSYAKALVRTGRFDQIRLVPFRAVNYVLGSYKACVVSGGVVQTREVKLGDRFGDDVEIIEGLSGGEQVATSQIARLDTGTRVRIAAPEERP